MTDKKTSLRAALNHDFVAAQITAARITTIQLAPAWPNIHGRDLLHAQNMAWTAAQKALRESGLDGALADYRAQRFGNVTLAVEDEAWQIVEDTFAALIDGARNPKQ